MRKAAEILGVEHQRLSFVDSGLPEGDPTPPLPEGCCAGLEPLEEPTEALVQGDPASSSRTDDHLRRTAATPPRPHPLPPGVGRRLRRVPPPTTGSPRRRRGTVEDQQAVLQPRLRAAAHAAAAGGVRQARPAGAVREMAQALGSGARRVRRPRTTRVECSAYFSQRDDALRAHATQIDPTGDFSTRPSNGSKRLWSTEEFELASLAGADPPAGDRICSPVSSPTMTDTLMMIVGLLADEAPGNTGPDLRARRARSDC